MVCVIIDHAVINLIVSHSIHQDDHCIPDSKAHRVKVGPIWGRQDPGGPHVGPKNFAIWGALKIIVLDYGFVYFFTFDNFPSFLVQGIISLRRLAHFES